MPQYEFQGCDNQKCPGKDGHPKRVMIYIIPYSMKDVPDVGRKIPCPHCRKGKITRVISSGITSIVHKPFTGDDSGKTFMTNIKGQDTAITFVDHPHTDPNYDARMAQIARQTGISGAYFSEKHGRYCVDVASTQPDPLGQMSRCEYDQHKETTHVKTPVKISKTPRNRAKPKKANDRSSYIPIRRTS